MATLFAKFIGVVGVSGVVGFGIYKAFSSKITIKETILNSDLKDSTYSFLPKNSPLWSEIKKEYVKANSTHKPLKNGVVIPDNDLSNWCATEVESPFEGKEDAKYKSIIRWCYLSTNSFEKQADSKGRKLIAEPSPSAGTPDQVWKDAWNNKYKSKKNDLEWKISDGGGNLNGDNVDSAATDLKTWCGNKKVILMYVEGAKSDFKKFFEFCTDDKSGE